MPIPKRVVFKTFAGIKVQGETPVAVPTGEDVERHIARAFYLTARMEAPTWGSVQSYDNAGISGGPMHWIAHLPRTGEQGPLFPLLRTIEIGLGGVPNARFFALKAALAQVGWVVGASDGQLRSIIDGAVVGGRAVRDEFAAPGGLVPAAGPGRRKAERWAMLFYELLADEATFHAQREHAISYLLRGQRQAETEAYRLLLERPTLEDAGSVRATELQPAADLAMCVYHSHSVNAPGAAGQCLTPAARSLLVHRNGARFARDLMRRLATKKYGAWNKRYLRTRSDAQASGLWPTELFAGPNAVMPARFA